MIEVLGIRRILTLVVLVLLNAAIGAGVYLYFVPENQKLTNSLTQLTGQVVSKRAEVDRMRLEYTQIQEQKVYFEDLQAAGFFNDQGRVAARERIEAIQKKSQILNASYTISPAQIEMNEGAEKANHVVLNSLISFKIEAIDDIDVYNFVYWMENAFMGQVSVESLDIKRTQNVTEAVIRQIGTGTKTVLVEADLNMRWRTLSPKESVNLGAGAAQ
jgi:hypothetical protein